MSNSVTILLYIKRSKPSADGTVPIYMRVTVQGQRTEKSTGQFVKPDQWDSDTGKVKGNSEAARTINDYLTELKSEVLNHRTELMQVRKPVSHENMRRKIKQEDHQLHTIVDLFKDHNKKMKDLVGVKYAEGTLERYETSLSHTIEFMEWKYKIKDIDILNIDFDFISDYDHFLRTVRKCGNNTTIKYIKNFGKIIRIALKKKWLQDDPFVEYEKKLDKVEGIYLTDDELRRLIAKDLPFQRIDRVRDIFVFCCFTGLAYADVKKLNKAEIELGIDGNFWIYSDRTKTTVEATVPLLPMAIEILKKYKDDPECTNQDRLLPVLSNQKMNSYLKEIADLCTINKELTTHVARHTFATTVTLGNGVTMETVKYMMGHANLKSTQHYARVTENKVSKDMAVLQQGRQLEQYPIPLRIAN